MASGQDAIRFAVGTPDGARSSTWRVWASSDSSVFVSTRPIAGHLKVSLHSSGRWRIGFTDPAAAARIGAPPRDRAFDKFTPPPDVVPGVRHGVTVVIPWLAVGLAPHHKPEEGKIAWLAPLADGHVHIVDLILTAPNVVVVDGPEHLASLTLRNGSGVTLKQTTRAALPEEVTAWTDFQVRMSHEARVRATRTADADIMAFAVGDMADGTRCIFDLRIPEPA